LNSLLQEENEHIEALKKRLKCGDFSFHPEFSSPHDPQKLLQQSIPL